MNDLISRQAAIDAFEDTTFTKNEIQRRLSDLPSAQSKQLQVLANVLDGCPLTQPCDKIWKPDGWCEEHCKNNKLQEPDAECWLKYAEVIASEQ